MEIKKEVSCTLMVANLIATILVIAIHYNSKDAIDISKGLNWNYIFQEFLTNGIGRVAVPFFSIVSGFFVFDKLNSFPEYISLLKHKVKTLLVPYLIASTLIFIFVIILNRIFKPYLHHDTSMLSLFFSILVHPVSDQFWFLRDLMLLIIFSPILLKLKKYYNNLILLIISVLWILDLQIFPIIGGWYLVSIETIFFFCLGGKLFENESFIVSLIDANFFVKFITLSIWLTLIGLRVYIKPDLDVWYTRNYTIESLMLYKIAIIVGILYLIQFLSFFAKNEFFIYMSGFTFFAYLFHNVPLSYIRVFTSKIISTPYLFYLNFPLAVILVFLAAYLISKYLPNVYYFISGGRTYSKALNRIK